MKSGTGVRYSGKLKMHWNWSLYLAFTLIPFSAGMYLLDHRAGLAATAFTAFYFLAILFVWFYYRPRILRAIVRFASRYGTVQAQVLKQLEIAAAIVDKDGNVLWMNDKMCEMTGRPAWFQRNIMTIFPYLSKAVFPDSDEDKNIDLAYEDRQLRAHIQRIPLDNLIADSELIEAIDPESGSVVYMIYFVDETELQDLRIENKEQKGVVALLYLDNYEEAMDDVDEVHSSLMNVLVDREINKYCQAHRALSKKLEKDKYLVVMNQYCDQSIVKIKYDNMLAEKEAAITGIQGIVKDGIIIMILPTPRSRWRLAAAATRQSSTVTVICSSSAASPQAERGIRESRPGSRRRQCARSWKAREACWRWATSFRTWIPLERP